jgi:hypothetical protein
MTFTKVMATIIAIGLLTGFTIMLIANKNWDMVSAGAIIGLGTFFYRVIVIGWVSIMKEKKQDK